MQSFFPALTKIIATLGEKSRSVEVLAASLRAGMSVARFDFSHGEVDYHQATLDNLKEAIMSTNKLCSVMLDTVGPELQVVNKNEQEILLEADATIVLTPDQDKEASASLLPINFHGLAQSVNPGDKIYIGQYLFTGSETTSVWLEVSELRGEDVVCLIKSSGSLKGSLFTLHISRIRVDLPTLSDSDKDVISKWGVKNKIDFLSLSYTRHAEDVLHAREFLSEVGLSQTQIIAKIENIEGLTHFDEILKEADGIMVSRGNLAMDLPVEKVFLFQKAAIYKCNMAGKPAIVTRVVDSMTNNLRPTRAEATDVANAVLDGCDAILLGAETVRGLYPVEAISMVRAAIKVNAAAIIVFTSTGRTARLIAKYRPTMPVLNVVIPRIISNSIKWTLTGVFEADGSRRSNEPVLQAAIDYCKKAGIVKPNDRVAVCQKVGDASVVKILELDA
ncbi:Pyruvate kinase [Rhynchospora pubera]|uniref:Pyruvate kinase n=1 Tax=Rhynchospora pubera TaxID=906938 RepID=A0AAV8EA52_9POAL|nr:Pyruvate kinase [Rhynchospora pubera]KAJ4802341.1 Pyruvate kinase [Rhynchospora pubera]